MRIFILVILFAFSMSSCARRVVYTKATPQVVVIQKAPSTAKIVRVKGRRYHFWGGNYYQQSSKGFVLVKL